MADPRDRADAPLIGILQTGHVNPALVDAFGEYPPMFERLLGHGQPPPRFLTVDVVGGDAPPSIHAADQWLITGSKHGAYDPLPWIPPLEQFLRDAYAAEIPLIGICFGHQIMAQALGGVVEKSRKGWGCGVHSYTVRMPNAFAGHVENTFALHAMHQDQVTAAPKDAHVIAESAFCPFAALAYGPVDAPRAISVQPHPEFDRAFTRALVSLRRGNGIPEPEADAGLASLERDVDSARIADWILAFSAAAHRRRQAAQAAAS